MVGTCFWLEIIPADSSLSHDFCNTFYTTILTLKSSNVHHPGRLPRVASLRNSSSHEHLCGATLLTAEFALTAAHCVPYEAYQYVLQLNNYCLQEDEQPPRAVVLDVIPHEQYDKYVFEAE